LINPFSYLSTSSSKDGNSGSSTFSSYIPTSNPSLSQSSSSSSKGSKPTYACVLSSPAVYYPTVPTSSQLSKDSFLFDIRTGECKMNDCEWYY
jgi:hypothetical protein